MKKLVVLLTAFFVFLIPLFGYDVERIATGNGEALNYICSTDFEELENYTASEFGVRINIGDTDAWDDNSTNNNLSPQLRSYLRQKTQQGSYNSFAMAVFTNDYGDVVEIHLNWCYMDSKSRNYMYRTTYWEF